jgi:hypothetical protein
MRFVVDEVARVQNFPRLFLFSLIVIIPPLLLTRLSSLPEVANGPDIATRYYILGF